MKIDWNLRMLCAQRGIWTGAALNRVLVQRIGLSLTSQTMSNLMSKQPKRVSLNVLLALCAALECTPNDLLKVDTAVSAKAARKLVDEITATNQAKAPKNPRRRPGRRNLRPAPSTMI